MAKCVMVIVCVARRLGSPCAGQPQAIMRAINDGSGALVLKINDWKWYCASSGVTGLIMARWRKARYHRRASSYRLDRVHAGMPIVGIYRHKHRKASAARARRRSSMRHAGALLSTASRRLINRDAICSSSENHVAEPAYDAGRRGDADENAPAAGQNGGRGAREGRKMKCGRQRVARARHLGGVVHWPLTSSGGSWSGFSKWCLSMAWAQFLAKC